MQDELGQRLVDGHRRHADGTDPAVLERLGVLAEVRLNAIVDEAVRRQRIDLLRFIAVANQQIIARPVTCDKLDPKATLDARQRARVAHAGLLRVAARVELLHRRLRHVGFVDDGYERAQALLSAWEPLAVALGRADAQARALSGLAAAPANA